jgi:DNA-binding transcriptional ArsR family regulator
MKAAVNKADRVWRALGDDTRRRILDLLAGGPRTTGDIVAAFPDLARTGVMKHLEVLVACELALVRWQGRVRWNYLNAAPIQRVCDRWLGKYVQRAAVRLNRLKDVIERPS